MTSSNSVASEHHEDLQTLFDTSPDAIILHDSAGAILDVNDQAIEDLGYSREQLLSMDIPDIEVGISPDELRTLWEGLSLGERETVEGHHRRAGGSTFSVQVSIRKIELHDEVRFLTLSRDITERKEREQELERYEAMVESSRDVFWMFTDDFSENLYVNSVYEDVLGLSTEPLQEDPMAFMEGIHPDDREFMREQVETLQNGESADWQVRVNPTEEFTRWLWIKGEPIVQDGEHIAVAGFGRDITERKERERDLQRHRTYLESATDIITLIEPDGTIEYVSPAIERTLGFDPEELIGENGFKYVHPEDRSDRREDIVELGESPGAETVLEFRFQQADGSYRWLESTARNLLDDPDVEGLLLNSRDITDRKEYEQQLSTLHDTTKRLLNAESKQEVAEIAVDASQNLLKFSLPSVWYPTEKETELTLVANSAEHQALLEEAGTPDPTHPANSWMWDVFGSEDAVVRSPIQTDDLAADVPLQSAIILPLGEHGILGCAAKGEIEFSDREIRTAEILAQNVRTALDQLAQRNALERQKAFTDDLLDAIEDVVYVLDTNGDFEKWNVALEEVTGYNHDEIGSMNAVDFFAEEDAETAQAAVEEAFETGRGRVELDFLTADGESIPYEFIANTFEDPTGEPVIAGIGRDRSVHVEYEQRLEEQRDNLEVLNQVVRHDIRNDMTVVRGRGGLLDEHIDSEGQEHLEAVLRATENAIELTKTARDLSETMQSTEADVEPVRLDQHLRSPIENARSEFDDAIITVEDRIPDVRIRGNDLLEAVFRNLIQNAVVHNDKDAPGVCISTTADDGTLTVAVADNGPGISDDQKETIFGKGEKGLDSPGTGIGLYLVRTLVDQYGGDVWVEDNERKGSVFVVQLPIVE